MKNITLKSCLVFGTLMFSACGPQTFVPSAVTSNQKAGYVNVPPKVDIVLGVSMNGTMQNIYPGIQNEIPAFLQGLQTSGWDYRFVGIPLSEYQPTATSAQFPIAGKVTPSKFHNNWPSANWISPFPGASYTDPLLGLLPSLFNPNFVVPPLSYATNDGHETGLLNQINFLTRADVNSGNPTTGILRPDAVLAVITLSNGDDRSGGTWAWSTTFNRMMWTPGPASTYQGYANTLTNLKPVGSNLVKYFAMVPHLTDNCRGYGAWSGIRYEDFSASVGGTNIDICTVEFAAALNAVAANLQQVRLNFRKKYLVVGTEPNPSTIQVKKYLGGTGSPITIPQSASDGWTYAGYQTNLDTIDSPISMEPATGYFIELHGTAKLLGEDSAEITYQNAGSVNAN